MAKQQAQDTHSSHGGSMKSYIVGFLFSIILTIIPLVLVLNNMLSKTATTVIILAMAVLQFLVQLVFFMHIRDEEKPRFNLMALVFGLVIMVVIVAGSIWIMTYNAVVTS
ncbi:Cytochrome bo(3) ubiquinol oxidase subunit 4 [compost metagenome]